MLSVSITTNIISLNPANGEVYSIQRWNLSLTCDWSVVFFGYSGFLHQWIFRRYARCWWHLTLHIINIEKNVSRLLFHFFFFFICVCIPWVWLGWRWCGCVLMYCSLFRNFTFLFLLIFILFWLAWCCWCFSIGVYFNVCLFAYLFRLYSLLVFIDCLCYMTTLSFFLWKYICCNTWLSYSVCLFIDWLYTLYSWKVLIISYV